jgi:hypothetical protein
MEYTADCRDVTQNADMIEENSAGIFASSAMSDVLLPRGTQSADFRSRSASFEVLFPLQSAHKTQFLNLSSPTEKTPT